MPGQGRWPKPIPEPCSACNSVAFDGLGPTGHWDGPDRGGLLYAARCLRCGMRWIGYGGRGPGRDEHASDSSLGEGKDRWPSRGKLAAGFAASGKRPISFQFHGLIGTQKLGVQKFETTAVAQKGIG